MRPREIIERLWALLPDKCERPDCSRAGVRGNENRVNGQIVCDYCYCKDKQAELAKTIAETGKRAEAAIQQLQEQRKVHWWQRLTRWGG